MPEPASLKEYAPKNSPDANFGKYFFFCSSFPLRAIVMEQSPTCTATITPRDASTLDNSSTTIASEISSNFCPPYSSGIVIPANPNSENFLNSSIGEICSLSLLSHVGPATVSENSRTILRIIFWSSVSAKSIFLSTH